MNLFNIEDLASINIESMASFDLSIHIYKFDLVDKKEGRVSQGICSLDLIAPSYASLLMLCM
jgi:hypothetical protein